MASPSNIVRVPKPSKNAFNPHRLLAKNTLMLNQVKHFHDLELKLPQEQRTGIDFTTILTEGQASQYIRKMTHIMHPHSAPQTKKSGGK
jgi:hypothetical protein